MHCCGLETAPIKYYPRSSQQSLAFFAEASHHWVDGVIFREMLRQLIETDQSPVALPSVTAMAA
jgi:hypothetical protein